jgi:hypothetical protein
MSKETVKAYVLTDLTAELVVENMDSEYGEDDYAELNGRDLTDYEGSIREYIEKEREQLDDGGNLAPYIDSSLPRLRENVLRIEPDVVVYEGKLCGCALVELRQELSERDWNALFDYISGQYSDGWGEGFEQRDIPVTDGILNVHFWQRDQHCPVVLDTLPGQGPAVPRQDEAGRSGRKYLLHPGAGQPAASPEWPGQTGRGNVPPCAGQRRLLQGPGDHQRVCPDRVVCTRKG